MNLSLILEKFLPNRKKSIFEECKNKIFSIKWGEDNKTSEISS